MHIVLLGDSVFDNAAYVETGSDVSRLLQSRMAAGGRATLRARDGAVLGDIPSQLTAVPRGATHLVISAGGNDALRDSAVLEESAASVAQALETLAAVRDRFERDYAEMIECAMEWALPLAICTIYEPRLPEERRRKVAATALPLLNDCITYQAFSRGLGLIDLRLTCNCEDDFANPIEPSEQGGAKIARAVAAFASGAVPASSVYA